MEDQGEEEETLLIIELPDRLASPGPGTVLRLSGLDTQTPELHLSDGTVLRGSLADSLGSTLVVHRAAPGGLLGHTDVTLRFGTSPQL